MAAGTASIAYGRHMAQVVDLWLPEDAAGAEGPVLVVLLHGGFWRARWDRAHLVPLAQQLAADGFAVALPEYRRIGSPGWSGYADTLDDLVAALAAVAAPTAAPSASALPAPPEPPNPARSDASGAVPSTPGLPARPATTVPPGPPTPAVPTTDAAVPSASRPPAPAPPGPPTPAVPAVGGAAPSGAVLPARPSAPAPSPARDGQGADIPSGAPTAGGLALRASRVVLVGHSAGGHLALWAASRHRLPAASRWRLARPYGRASAGDVGAAPLGVVALAACSCLGMADDMGLSDCAAAELMGGHLRERPDDYRLADPLGLLPLGPGVRLALLHGDADEDVPASLSARYAEAARAAGDHPEHVRLPGIGHMDLIAPSGPGYAALRAALATVIAKP